MRERRDLVGRGVDNAATSLFLHLPAPWELGILWKQDLPTEWPTSSDEADLAQGLGQSQGPAPEGSRGAPGPGEEKMPFGPPALSSRPCRVLSSLPERASKFFLLC